MDAPRLRGGGHKLNPPVLCIEVKNAVWGGAGVLDPHYCPEWGRVNDRNFVAIRLVCVTDVLVGFDVCCRARTQTHFLSRQNNGNVFDLLQK